MLAILAVALAALAPFALAAEGQGDNNAGKQPTMAELASKVDSLGTRLGSLTSTTGSLRTELGALATTVGTLASTVSANHATIVGKFAPQMAVVMSVPYWWSGSNGVASENLHVDLPRHYLVGNSTIPGFPAGTVAADGQFTDRTLPAGTYLFELQQPQSDNVLCNRSVSIRHRRNGNHGARRAVCPRLYMTTTSGGAHVRFNDGFSIAAFTAPTVFRAVHRFPTGFVATDDKPLASYTGAVRITKLK